MNRSCRLHLLAAILIASFLTPVATAAQIDPDQPIDLELERASLVETLKSFASISGSRLDVDPAVGGSVTLALERTPWRQVLDRICSDHQLNCELLSGEPPVLRVRSTEGAEGAAAQSGYAQAIDMWLKGGDLRETLQAFGMIGGIEVIVDDAVSGTLTIEIQDAPWTVVMEEACNLSGCRIEWGDPEGGQTEQESALHVLPADAATTAGRRTSLRFDRQPVAQALAALALEPIFGVLGQPELELAEGLEGTVDLELDRASWLEALNAVCRANPCHWQLTYGAPSRLAVRPKQKGLEDRVELPAGATTLGDAAAALAGWLDLETDLNPGLDPRTEVRFDAAEAVWRDAAEDLCRQAACLWTVHEGRLLLNPRVKTLSHRPAAGAEDRRVGVRFYAPDASAPVAGTARFNWAAPVKTFDAGGEQRWLARLAWIPFGPELDLVAPMILSCAAGGAELELLAPVRWPVAKPVTRQWRGAILELSSPTDSEAGAAGTARETDCLGAGAGEIHATFRRAGAQTGAHETTFDLEARAGAYLLVTPPGSGQPAPVAAVLALGAGGEGRQRVAILKPASGDDGFTVDRRTLPESGDLRETVAALDGARFELRLRSHDRQ